MDFLYILYFKPCLVIEYDLKYSLSGTFLGHWEVLGTHLPSSGMAQNIYNIWFFYLHLLGEIWGSFCSVADSTVPFK